MSFTNYSVHHNFILASVVGNYAVGTVLVQRTEGDFIISTSANRALYNRSSAGIMRTPGDGTRNQAVDVQVNGLIPAAIAGVGTGSADEWVRVSTTGFLERVASPGGSDDVVGKADADGNVTGCLFGGLLDPSGGGGGGDSPGTPDKSLQYRVNGTTFGGDAYWTREAAGRLNGTYYDPVDGVTVRSLITVGNPATDTFPAFGFMRFAEELVNPGSLSLITYHDGVTGRAALGVSGGILFLGDTGITNETQVYGSKVTLTSGGPATVGGFSVSEIVLGSLTGSNGALSVASTGKIRRSLGSALQVLRTNAGATDVEWGAASGGIAGTKTVEEFGAAIGGSASANQTALAAAFADLGVGCKTLIFGSGTYLATTWGFTIPVGCSVLGQGADVTILETQAATSMLRIGAVDGWRLHGFTLLGTSTSNADAFGIRLGLTGVGVSGPGAGVISEVTVKKFASAGVVSFNSSSSEQKGVIFIGCRAYQCGAGFRTAQQGEYANFVGCRAEGCGTGIEIGSGNISQVGCIWTSNTVGVDLVAGTNDGHGTASGCEINHNGTANVRATGILVGYTFSACCIIAGPISITNSVGIQFDGCKINGAGWTFVFDNSVTTTFVGCTWYGTDPTITESNNPGTYFSADNVNMDGNVPTWIAQRRALAYTFPGDANQTLTKTQSQAASIKIATGVISTGRTLTSTQTAASRREVLVENDNAQAVTFAWASGTGAVVPAGLSAIVGSDGTNATLKLQETAAGGATSLTVGTAPQPTVGEIKLGSGGTTETLAYMRNSANSADLPVLQKVSGNEIYIGTNSAFSAWLSGIRLWVVNGGTIYFGTNTTTEALVNGQGLASMTGRNFSVLGSVSAGSASFGSGAGVMFVGNATTNPSANPTAGGVLYADAGAGKWRGSGGTVTTFGPADPHCPTCGRDFAIEHQNDTHGEHLALCLPCLVDALVSAGVDTKRFTIADKRGATKKAWDDAHAETKARDAKARADTEAAVEARRNLAVMNGTVFTH